MITTRQARGPTATLRNLQTTQRFTQGLAWAAVVGVIIVGAAFLATAIVLGLREDRRNSRQQDQIKELQAEIDAINTTDVDYSELGFTAFISTRPTIPSGVSTTVVFDNTQLAFGGNNPGGHYDNTTGIYTVPQPGFYSVGAQLAFPANGTGTRRMTLLLAFSAGDANPSVTELSYLALAMPRFVAPSLIAPGTISVSALQTSGGPLLPVAGFFTVSYLGPLP